MEKYNRIRELNIYRDEELKEMFPPRIMPPGFYHDDVFGGGRFRGRGATENW